MRNLIINFTPTGMVPTRSMNPNVPLSVNEIVEEVHEACDIGITMVHLHARDPESEKPTHRKDVYAGIVEGIRKFCPELILCVSLSGRSNPAFQPRSEAIELYPDMGSLTLSSLNFPRQASINTPDVIQQLAQKMLDYGVKPELEVFDLGMINYAHYLIRKKLIRPPYYFNIILGNISGLQTRLDQIGAAIRDLPNDSYWSLGGIGKFQLAANNIAIAIGGGVRVGLEDNLYFDREKKVLTRNRDLLLRIHELAEMYERKIMKPEELGNAGFYNTKRPRH